MSEESERHAMCCELIHDVGRNSGEVRLKVTGASMLPAIRPGDVIRVQRCDLAELRPGQVVLFHRDGKLTAHRIQKVFTDHLIARGDSVKIADPPVKADEIVGNVVSTLRGSRIIDPAQTTWQLVASSILRNSDICLRITLFLYRRFQLRPPLAN